MNVLPLTSWNCFDSTASRKKGEGMGKLASYHSGDRALSFGLTLTRKNGRRECLNLLNIACARARSRQANKDGASGLLCGLA